MTKEKTVMNDLEMRGEDNVLSPDERKNADRMFHSIIAEMKKRHMPDVSLLKKAYHFAMRSHGITRRKTGEPYIMHPLEVAKILAEVGFESDIIAGAILHDVITECEVSITEIAERFAFYYL